jgi:hypothetical protein
MAIQHNMLSTHIVCIAIHLLITDTFSTPTGDYTSNRLESPTLKQGGCSPRDYRVAATIRGKECEKLRR